MLSLHAAGPASTLVAFHEVPALLAQEANILREWQPVEDFVEGWKAFSLGNWG